MELMALCALIGVTLIFLGVCAQRLRTQEKTLQAQLVAITTERAALAKRPKSVEAQEVLAELMRGGAILQITVLNADDLYLRSPR